MFNQHEQHNKRQNEPSATVGRRVLVAYPIRYARQDENGRLTLDPSYASELRSTAAPADPVEARPVAGQRVPVWEAGLLLMVGTAVILIDQLTKRIVEARMPLYSESVPLDALFPYFRFTHTANYGAAFGMFQDGGLVFGLIAAIVAIAILIYNFGLPPGQRLLRIALGLQLGGALGNLIDRLRLGYVTDFLDVDFSTIIHIPYFSDWPIFNLADTSIVAGVLLLAYLMLTMKEHEQAEEAEKQAPRPTVRVVTGDE